MTWVLALGGFALIFIAGGLLIGWLTHGYDPDEYL